MGIPHPPRLKEHGPETADTESGAGRDDRRDAVVEGSEDEPRTPQAEEAVAKKDHVSDQSN